MKIILYLIIFSVLFVLYVRYLEQNSVFYPSKLLNATPRMIGLPFEDVQLQTADHLYLHGWFIPALKAKTTLLFLHGNAGNIGDRLGKIGLFHNLGLNIFILDYRGYGKSEGTPGEQGLYQDAIAAYTYLIKRGDIDTKRIVVYGESLGGAPAIDLAGKVPVAAIMVDSSFTSAVEMAKKIYPFVPSFLIRIKLDNLSKIDRVVCPKLFIHSSEDEIIPFTLGQKLFKAAREPKRFLTISGDHNDGFLRDPVKYLDGLKGFLEEQGLM